MAKRGRPLKFTPIKLKKKFKEYIDHCIKEELFPNIAGFAVYANFNRDNYYEYQKNRPEFSDTIKEIEALLEDVTLQQGIIKPSSFLIFYMKNKFNYTDKQDIDLTSNNKELTALTSEAHKIMKEAIGGDDQ